MRAQEELDKLGHEWDELRTSGLLWLINTTCLHPRGYALAIVYDDGGDATGWSIQGDGLEPIVFPDDATVKHRFRSVKQLLK